jgi:hypothetical protein
MENFEERLEQMISRYELEIQRLQAYTEIQNLMGKYETYRFTPAGMSRTYELFALWRDDCTLEISDGNIVYGADGIRAYYQNMPPNDGIGSALFDTLASPCIQVAGNGKTAKATWASPGLGVGKIPNQEHRSNWCWGKYAIDFIRNPESGAWKIWHFHWYRIIRNDYHMSFTEFMEYEDSGEYERKNPGLAEIRKGPGTPTLPPIFHQTLSLQKKTHPFPIAPEPYYDYDGDPRWQYGNEALEKEYGITYPEYGKFYNVNYPEKI